MKTKSFTIVSFFIICFFTLTSMTIAQDRQTFEGVYDGHEDYGFNFMGIDEDDLEYIMTFQNVDESIFKTFDLNSEKFVGTKFAITYTSKIEITKDDDDYEDETEVYTVVSLKKL
ncbi:MAG: hypothetical protein ACJARX_000449 [Psychroserpens sp.]|jgi:hypothetical protein|uniref:hypothetical protein n=1 Tax=Psychroserpens sp. TaxID=2020870 RepID=UPI0039E5B4F8